MRVWGRIDIDLHPAFGRLFDLLDPGIKRVRRPPAGGRVLVGKGELDFLCARQRRKIR